MKQEINKNSTSQCNVSVQHRPLSHKGDKIVEGLSDLDFRLPLQARSNSASVGSLFPAHSQYFTASFQDTCTTGWSILNNKKAQKHNVNRIINWQLLSNS